MTTLCFEWGMMRSVAVVWHAVDEAENWRQFKQGLLQIAGPISKK